MSTTKRIFVKKLITWNFCGLSDQRKSRNQPGGCARRLRTITVHRMDINRQHNARLRQRERPNGRKKNGVVSKRLNNNFRLLKRVGPWRLTKNVRLRWNASPSYKRFM